MKKISIARIAIALGIIFAVGKLLSVAVIAWVSWVTPFEKRDIRRALDEIDKARTFQGQEDVEYDRQIATARDAVAVCKKQSITLYDSEMVVFLQTHLDFVVAREKIWQLPNSNPRKRQGLSFLEQQDEKTEAMIRSHVM